MKKILALCLTMFMVASLSVISFAASEETSPSPSGYPTPGIEKFDPADDDCTAELIITPYGDKDKLPDDLREMFEDAYEQITGTDDITEINDELKKLIEDLGIDPDDLAISDFFNLHTEGCDNNHDKHNPYDITLDADSLSKFVGLIHMNEKGEWVLVKDAKIAGNGDHLQFITDSFGPYAIIINTNDNAVTGTTGTTQAPQNAPQTGMTHSSSHVYSVIMIACVTAAIATAVKCRRRATR